MEQKIDRIMQMTDNYLERFDKVLIGIYYLSPLNIPARSLPPEQPDRTGQKVCISSKINSRYSSRHDNLARLEYAAIRKCAVRVKIMTQYRTKTDFFRLCTKYRLIFYRGLRLYCKKVYIKM